MVVTLLYQYQM